MNEQLMESIFWRFVASCHGWQIAEAGVHIRSFHGYNLEIYRMGPALWTVTAWQSRDPTDLNWAPAELDIDIDVPDEIAARLSNRWYGHMTAQDRRH